MTDFIGDLVAQIRSLVELADAGDADAASLVLDIENLFSEAPTSRMWGQRTEPDNHVVDWETDSYTHRPQGGGRQSIEAYRAKAAEFGILLDRGIRWMPARDIVRAWDWALDDVARNFSGLSVREEL